MRICMASDFFYPNTGGVEAHIWQLSHYLMELNHEVIVITHAYGTRVGVSYITNKLKVYYLPFSLYPKQNIIWPLIFNTFSLVRQILIKEQINIVHGHSAFSPMAHQVMFHAKTLGISTVFTDHSLFGFNDFGAIIHKQIVKLSLMQCNHIICVSHVGRENKALKLRIGSDSRNLKEFKDDKSLKFNSLNCNNYNNGDTYQNSIQSKRNFIGEKKSDYNRNCNNNNLIPISVIPNAVDTYMFTPDPSQRDPNKITIIVNSRLVYRKGIDLLAAVLPKICQLNSKVQFIIAGDGPKRGLLETAVKQNQLSNRVLFLGSVPHDQVRNILVQGDIFLNTSLIEAFCMAIVEAASCGLYVVSTNVGGLPEVLPPKLIKLTEPTVDGLVNGVEIAISELNDKKFLSPMEAHEIIENSYSWKDVAKQTENVYNSVIQEPIYDLKHRIKRYYQSNLSFKYLFILLMLIDHLLLLAFDWYDPGHESSYLCNSPPSSNSKIENGRRNIKNPKLSISEDRRRGNIGIS